MKSEKNQTQISYSSFLDENYNLLAAVEELAGYQDKNYRVTTTSGDRFILKITVDPDDLDFIRSQNRLLTALSLKPSGKILPVSLPNKDGGLITEIQVDGKPAFARVFSYIEGEFLANAKPSLEFFHDLGRAFGQLDLDLAGLEDPVLKCRTHEWDLSRVLELKEDTCLIEDPADRRLVSYYLMKYQEEVQPYYHQLPKCLIHADGNDWNILTDWTHGHPGDHRVVGIIDFGDMLWGARVNEIAIVLAYAMMGRDDFAEVYQQVINGYQEVIRLTELELSRVYFIVAARWCQTMVMAARQKHANPGNAYHQISLSGARKMLHRWVGENPIRMVRNVKNVKNVKMVKKEREEVEERVEERYRYFSRALSLSYSQPIHMVGAALQYMYAADGTTYLDCVNNIPHVGHCHPRVVEAGQRQMARLNTNTRYLYDSLDRYAEKLLSKFPASLNRVFLVNSGSAATDLAVRLAEAHTGRSEFMVLDYAYHGNTKAAIGLSPYKFNRKGGKGKPDNVTVVATDGARNDLLPGKKVGKSLLTFFAESIVGCAGQVVLQKEFMQQLVKDVRASGGIYVADEVQTGFGRVGYKFWGFELYDVVPDMVILGKPMGNGHPMGAVVCTEAIAKSFETGMEFFSSFGGNPVSCEIGLAVLDVIEEEGLQENARLVGDFLMMELKRLFPDADVRGSGLFLGIELAEPESRKPATDEAILIVNRMKERGFLLSTDGPFNNVIKFKPPICFSMENARDLIDALKAISYH
jgi:4-aminobutyrate aminotransferase-like enzyme/Ser/Thr protein kinase RdoA (MazF antagonist)